MKQRCGIARALYYGSELLLMDEPFKSLDPGLRCEMLENRRIPEEITLPETQNLRDVLRKENLKLKHRIMGRLSME